MLFSIKRIVVMSTAVVILSAVFAGSASANWFINGAELKTTAAVASTAAVDEAPTLSVPALNLKVACSGSQTSHLFFVLLDDGILHIITLHFLVCNTTVPASGCALEEANQTISTFGLNGLASLGATAPEDRVKITPQTKTTIAEIAFNAGNTCAFNGVEPVKGSVTYGLPTGQSEGVTQALTGLGSVENNSLEIGAGNKAFLTGKTLLKLASGSKWSFK